MSSLEVLARSYRDGHTVATFRLSASLPLQNGRVVSPPSNLLTRIVGGTLLLVSGTVILVAAISWLLPLEVVQAWAVNRAPADDFSRFEAFSASTAATWFVRWSSTGVGLALCMAYIRHRIAVPFLTQGLTEFWRLTNLDPAGMLVTTAPTQIERDAVTANRPSWRGWMNSSVLRLFIVGWMLLALIQLGASLQRRLWDWPVYGLRSGNAVLPNISDSNREVIRYLQEVTPPGARILVLSDQKLFFLSYYLLPRRVYHPAHPDSEFVIAQPFNQRPMAAYRWEEIDQQRIDHLNPDFILEYFEGASFLAGSDLNQDSNWLAFQKRRRGPDWRPQYLVSLRPYSSKSSS